MWFYQSHFAECYRTQYYRERGEDVKARTVSGTINYCQACIKHVSNTTLTAHSQLLFQTRCVSEASSREKARVGPDLKCRGEPQDTADVINNPGLHQKGFYQKLFFDPRLILRSRILVNHIRVKTWRLEVMLLRGMSSVM